jgi:hypothetical protein
MGIVEITPLAEREDSPSWRRYGKIFLKNIYFMI